MKMTAASLARAFVETAKTLHESEMHALADAAAHILIEQGIFKDAHIFPRMVEREWFKRTGAVQVSITTAGSSAGTLKKDIAQVVEQSLQRSCLVEERADPSLLGGILLEIGDERYDATLRGALNSLSVQLTAPIPLS
ncbi:MAG: F0F1 ATP synthase subunit delta [Candidatus Peribacteraceae bacterium]|nr:F0F1 ATP synthase subunit delta [Candidatus Peribacteraceae bacterium]MDD5742179.1 F0F1 ATP synthase subunit delta [Candidatus Peribacteraceae bacterium]